MASREVVNTYDCLPKREQFLKEIGTDEPSDSGDDPNLGSGQQPIAKMPVRCGNHELTVEGYPPSRFRAVVRGSTTARSNAPPTAAIHVRRQGIFHSHRAQGSQQYLSSISRVSTGAYERGGTLLCAGLHFFVAALPHSCGGRTTTHTHVSQQRFLGEVGPLHPSQCHDWKPGPIKRLQAGLVKPWSDALPSQAWLWR